MYDVPSPEEIRAFMIENALTGADMAALTGVESRTARRWVAPADQKGAIPIPWAAWALIGILTGKTTRADLLERISQWKADRTGRKLYERGPAGRPMAENPPENKEGDN
jgi:hypothetical protein